MEGLALKYCGLAAKPHQTFGHFLISSERCKTRKNFSHCIGARPEKAVWFVIHQICHDLYTLWKNNVLIVFLLCCKISMRGKVVKNHGPKTQVGGWNLYTRQIIWFPELDLFNVLWIFTVFHRYAPIMDFIDLIFYEIHEIEMASRVKFWKTAVLMV